ncbi:MAG: Hpt domain-containing protein [Ruminococcus sp.]|nr:Hpt domain-containing protein [Ruminococcus sp.]
MGLKECYKELGGSFEEVSKRLPKESMIMKFVLKFLNDKSFENLTTAIENHDYSTAFMAAHTLKGVCQNLSFTRLYESSHLITEALRGDEHDESLISELVKKVTEDYKVTADAIKKLET